VRVCVCMRELVRSQSWHYQLLAATPTSITQSTKQCPGWLQEKRHSVLKLTGTIHRNKIRDVVCNYFIYTIVACWPFIDVIWYDMIWYYMIYDIRVNCNWVDTRWQQHLHTNSTQNKKKQNTRNITYSYVTIRIHKHYKNYIIYTNRSTQNIQPYIQWYRI
jgi:hypothetical protein